MIMPMTEDTFMADFEVAMGRRPDQERFGLPQ